MNEKKGSDSGREGGRGQLKTCMRCRMLFPYSGFGHCICERCRKREEKEFDLIRDFLYDHPKATMVDVSIETGIPVYQLEAYLRAGRLIIPNDSAIFIKCEKCGVDIRTGRFCPTCAQSLTLEMKKSLEFDEYQVGELPVKKSGKMRFLEGRHE